MSDLFIALRLKWVSGEPGYYRSYYQDENTGDFYTLTDCCGTRRWHTTDCIDAEPDMPLKRGTLIQIVEDDKFVSREVISTLDREGESISVPIVNDEFDYHKSVYKSDIDETRNVEAIKDIEKRYGSSLLYMAVSKLTNKGFNNFTEDYVAKAIQNIIAKDEDGRLKSSSPIISAEFACNIIYCAAELSKFNIWDLFYYIKNYTEFSKL